MVRPKKQKSKWKNCGKYDYNEEWNDQRDEYWERFITKEGFEK
ncbi:MAG: hypothetical protein ABIG93_03040 [archaeon]